MAHKFIIDDTSGALYKDFTGRRVTTAAELLRAERGLTPTFEIYSINVATDTGAVTGQTLTNGNLSVSIGLAGKAPEKGLVKAAFTVSGTTYESANLEIENINGNAIESAFNNSVYPVYIAGGLTVDELGEGKWLLTMKKVGAVTGSPSLNVESSDPPSAVEVNSVRTGDSDTKAQWIINLIQSPVANIATGSWSSATSGSYSGLSSTISLNTTAMLSSIARGQRDFEISIIHSGQVLHRSSVSIHESLDPTAAGSIVVTSPTLFTLGSNAVNQGETIAISGGLTYDGTTLAAPFLPLAGGTMTGDAVFNDGVKAIFGTSSDGIEIYHSSDENYIDDSGTGRLFIRSNGSGVFLQKTDGENLAKFKTDGATELYYDNSKKFETTGTGATISGKLIVNGDMDVSGFTTTFNSTVVTVDDPVFGIGGDTAPGSDDNKDRGIEFRYYSGSAKVGFFGYDDSEDAFTFLTDATNNSEVFSGTLANLKTGSITGTNFYATQIRTENGSASFPSHSFTGDSNSGIFGGTDIIGFSTGGTEAARFDSSGNFVIGATTALAKLDVQLEAGAWNVGSSFTNKAVRISGGSGGLGLAYDDTTGGTIAAIHHGNSWKNLNFGAVQHIFDINGSEAMRLNSTGLGIGGTPSARLEITTASQGDTALQVGYTTSTPNLIVGTSTGSTKLEIANGNYHHKFYSRNASGTSVERLAIEGGSDTANIKIINSNLGIGVTPSEKLTVDGNIRVGNGTNIFLWNDNNNNYLNYANWVASTGSQLTVQNNGVGGIHLKANATNADVIFSAKDGTTLNELLRLDGSASSINVPDDVQLNIGSGIDLIHNSTNGFFKNNVGDLYIETTANGKDTIFKNDNDSGTATELLRLDGSTGFVGIGTASPANTLDILGKASINSDGSILWGNARDYGKLTWDTGKAIVRGQSGKALSLGANGSQDYLWIATNGNVGIGDSSPDKTFTVNGNSKFYNTSSSKYIEIYGGNSANFIDSFSNDLFLRYGGDSSKAIVLNSSGNVGIGTSSPVSPLTVESNLNALADADEPENYHLLLRNPANDTNEGVGMGFLVSGATNDVGGAIVCKRTGNNAQSELQFWNKQNITVDGVVTQAMTIASDGNVGISTDSPSANADLTLGGGALCMAETTEPTADANFGKIYCKSDNKLYFQDGAGTEHEIAFV